MAVMNLIILSIWYDYNVCWDDGMGRKFFCWDGDKIMGWGKSMEWDGRQFMGMGWGQFILLCHSLNRMTSSRYPKYLNNRQPCQLITHPLLHLHTNLSPNQCSKLAEIQHVQKRMMTFNITHKPIQRIKCCCQVQWELFVEHKGKFGCCLPRQYKWLIRLTPRIKPESTRLDLSQRHSEHEELNATESIQSYKPHVKLWCDQRCHHWRGWPCCVHRCLHC